MSHFFAVVFVEDTTPKIEEKVAELLAPYDEGKKVEPYNKPCYCVGTIAKRDAIIEADKREGTIESFRQSFQKSHGEEQANNTKILYSKKGEHPQEVVNKAAASEANLNKLWKKHILRRQSLEEELLNKHPLKDTPEKNCSECDGTGVETTTYNPKSQWDWYVVGGRWDGEMLGVDRSSDGGFNFGEKHHLLEFNSIKVKDIKPNIFSCYAIITPDGEWHSKGKMGWFGCSMDEKEDWSETTKELLKKYSNCIAIGIDCHI